MIFMNEGMRRRDRGPRGCLSGRFGANIQLLESLPFVDRGREEPTDNENPDDHVSDHPEIVVQAADGIPEPAAQMKFVCKQTEPLDAADQQRHYHRDCRNSDVVIALADRFDERPGCPRR
jgi:hypothetical protein